MDLDSIEGMNEIRPSVYRAAMKLLSLQKLCHMHVVSVRHVMAGFHPVGGARQLTMRREEVTHVLNSMFDGASQDVPGHVTAAGPEETCSLVFRLFDRTQTGCVSAHSLQTALIALSSDNLLVKYRGLLDMSENSSGSVSRSGLRSLLQDLSQVPAAVQEDAVFGGVEAAVRSCFNGVLTPTATKEHVLSWLQSEPRLLLWLPTVYRLSVSQNVTHSVRCHACKTFPISGLRYRCMKCVNVHVCQSCFLTDRHTKKHKAHHPVLEFCTQPTWKESLSSLAHSACNALLPRRYTQREADRKRVLMWAEGAETQNSAPPPSDASTQLANAADSDQDVSHDAWKHPNTPCLSKALQTDDETPAQQASALLTEVRNLQRDKWLLEQQLQAWRLTVQSEQGILEDRCAEMEVTMETLRQHNNRLQAMLTQALNKMAAQQDTNNSPQSVNTTLTSDAQRNTNEEEDEEDENEEEDEEENEEEDEEDEDRTQTPSPTVYQSSPLTYEEHCEVKDDIQHPAGRDGAEKAELQVEDLSEGEEDCGTCSPEKRLQEAVNRLKAVMEVDRWTETHTGDRKGATLVQSADRVGDSVRHLVDAVKTH
ncbi:dystrotelin [Parambassis ranga]|uniref:Dystrotelin n=1 Tax=Parambassis ranga TaxID=210632 RepID=A0A6P7HMF8_9TELE|nr:dystrotelin [Parambassis ranga]